MLKKKKGIKTIITTPDKSANSIVPVFAYNPLCLTSFLSKLD